jgi:hypothetical protein
MHIPRVTGEYQILHERGVESETLRGLVIADSPIIGVWGGTARTETIEGFIYLFIYLFNQYIA